MGQLRLVGADAAAALETLMPVDVSTWRRASSATRCFTNDDGGILDDLMFDAARATTCSLIVNAACKEADIAPPACTHIGTAAQVQPLPDRALLALQGPKAVDRAGAAERPASASWSS